MRTLQTPGNGQSMVKVFLITFQYVSGCQLPLPHYLTRQAPHLEGHFYKYIRQFLSGNESSLEIDYVKPLQQEREDDRFTIDIVCENIKLETESIEKINYYRLFLQVHGLLDICTADGNFIFDSVYIGQRSYGLSSSRAFGVVQERPEMKSYRV